MTSHPSRRGSRFLPLFLILAFVLGASFSARSLAAEIEVGVAVRDITPDQPIWLAGYAARKRPSERVDHKLLVQAMAFRTGDQRFVFVSLDNCEVSHGFMAPLLTELERMHQLKPGEVMVVSSHTHSAPILEHTLETMYQLTPADREQMLRYSRLLRERLVEVVGAALTDLKPSVLEHGVGQARFAMNRRIYREDGIAFGENPDGPVDWDVPVLRVKPAGTNDTVRAILFGYACHGTTIAGDDFYIVSGDYMAYAREQLENHYPGAVAVYLTGMGADSNPSPRGKLLDAKRHGLELAGAVVSVLNRPMRRVDGTLKLAFTELELPLEGPPQRAQIEKDAQSKDYYVRARAQSYLQRLERGEALPTAVKLPLAAVRVGDDLTFVAMGGEVVVDYAIRFKRMFGSDHPWLIGYAYEVPCYIPSVRIIKEGGYEADSSLIYYGLYGPFRLNVESLLLSKMTELVRGVR